MAARGAGAAARAHAAHRRAGSRTPRTIRKRKVRFAAFLQGLQQLGWTDGGNVRIDARWTAGSADDIRKHAAELVALAPDVILAHGSSTVGPLLQATRTVPIVFVVVLDPVGAGFVESLARPGGNATGFITFEYGMSAKWLELLKQIAPGVTRAAVLRDPATSAGIGQFGAIQAVAPSFGVEVSPIDVHDAGEIERADHSLRAHAEWRTDRDGQRVDGPSSRSDHHAGGPVQAARGLLRTLLRHRRRPDLLWSRFPSTSTDARPVTSIAFSKARNQPTCQCRRRPS